ncbi:transporter substrate-binding domain-containing protein [Bifidobacterium callitrichos]|nr:transporter substrate-binding domain-containing protein [Bifidobacterium callitrichos]
MTGRMTRRMRVACSMLLSVAMTAAFAGCGEAPRTFVQPEGPTIAIGVAADEPGLARWHGGAYEGFEVDVARYIAKKLGYANKQIVFKQVLPSNRLDLLDDGTVDMVVASMPMPRTSSSIAYAGPYLQVAQGLLVRPDDAGTITEPSALAGRDVCVVSGSGARESLLAVQPKALPRERDTYPQCVTDLMIGTADAIAGDDVILSGLARSQGADIAVRVDGVSYGRRRYAIALPSGAGTLAQNVDAALKDMRDDGTYDALLRTLRADTGWSRGR